ncbi:MAG: 4-oxalocrotonate tautomerase family protein [Sideroxydans sp.]|nr:4-oxalocrotonate tautomerase family protein [Sideroxydans sp.]
MPILHVTISAKKSPQMTQAISTILLDLTGRILKKKPEVTSIAISYIDPDDWIIGGKSLTELGKSSIYFDIKITDETNTKAEKSQYIHEAFEAFKNLLGDLHEVSYIYVEDVRATAYGYGGLTQEYRYHQ